MVTDRIITASNGSASVVLTSSPYSVEKISGWDRLEVTNVTSQGFDQDGASLLNSYITPRDMEISGQIKASTTEQMQKLRDDLANVFIPKKDITITHYYGGVKREITVRAAKTPSFTFSKVSAIQDYEINLIAPDPYWRDETATIKMIAHVPGYFHFPLEIPENTGVTFGIKSASLIVNAYNISNVRVGMEFTFIAKGAVVNPYLFNIVSREYMRLVCEMEGGEKITVVTGQDKSVTRKFNGAEEDYIGTVDLAGGGNTFLELSPGDNLLRHGADSGEGLLETKITFYNKYVGV